MRNDLFMKIKVPVKSSAPSGLQSDNTLISGNRSIVFMRKLIRGELYIIESNKTLKNQFIHLVRHILRWNDELIDYFYCSL